VKKEHIVAYVTNFNMLTGSINSCWYERANQAYNCKRWT